MKENKKLVNEIISDVKHDMSNEDIISLLADSRISANPDKENTHSVSAPRIKLRNLPAAGRSYSRSPPC